MRSPTSTAIASRSFCLWLSEQCQDSILIIQLDQAGAHQAKRLKLPSNIVLMFQPSHSPEINLIERVWQHLKLGLRWPLPKHLDELQLLIRTRLEAMSQAVIVSLVGWDFILRALFVADI